MTIYEMALRATAFPVWAAACVAAGFLLKRIIWAAVSAGSITRWYFRCASISGFKKTQRPVWTYIPGEFFRKWASFMRSGPGSITATHDNGYWRGISDWSINGASK